MSPVKSESLTSSWLMPFISLCYLIAEAKTFNIMLNNSGESGHPCLIPDLRGKALSFSPLRMILTLGLSYMAFMVVVLSFSLASMNFLISSLTSWLAHSFFSKMFFSLPVFVTFPNFFLWLISSFIAF